MPAFKRYLLILLFNTLAFVLLQMMSTLTTFLLGFINEKYFGEQAIVYAAFVMVHIVANLGFLYYYQKKSLSRSQIIVGILAVIVLWGVYGLYIFNRDIWYDHNFRMRFSASI